MQEMEEELHDVGSSQKSGIILSAKSLEYRRSNPTIFREGKMQISDKVARNRRKETFEAAMQIHGGIVKSPQSVCIPAEIGLADTVSAKCSSSTLYKVLSTSKKITTCLIPKIYKSCLVDYEASDDNMVRSVAVYYGGGIMGKKKYRQVYRSVSYKKTATSKLGQRIKVANCPIPLLVPYNRLMPFVKTTQIGTLYSVYDTLCDGLLEEDKVKGSYRNLTELLLILAEFYLSKPSVYKLEWFNETNTFHVSLGGDGAPFGKYDTAYVPGW